MKEFTTLRAKARERRDKLVAQAYREWEESLRRIAELEQDLLGRDDINLKSLSACIDRIMPTDRPFSLVDLMAGLEALDPGRVFRKRSVDSHVFTLRKRGIVRRLKRAQGREPALYVRVGVDVEKLPFENMTLREVIVEVLGDRTMNRTELTVAMLEAGYQTTMKPRALNNAIGVELRKDRQRFRESRGKWKCV